MSDSYLKREFHYFVLTDYEIEEEYLRRMHNNGYKFVKVTLPGFYYFEPCEPEDVVYKLDFNPKSEVDQKSYIQMYKDYGWEYLQDMNEYSYFRKRAADTKNQDDLEIFSDDMSKLDMLKRIFVKRMLPIMAIFLLCVVPQIPRLFHTSAAGFAQGFLLGLGIVLFVVYVLIIGRCIAGFSRLQKKYTKHI